MNINNAEVIVCCDVDGTLIRPVNTRYDTDGQPLHNTVTITNPYNNKQYFYEVHIEHVDLLRMYKGRGFYIRVWTANGVQHAVSVVKALGLDDGTVDSVETKPIKNMDDKKSCIHIAGSRVFIPRTGFVEEV